MPEVREMWSDDELDAALGALRSEVDTDGRALARVRAELVTAAGGGSRRPVEEPPRRRRVWWAVSAAAVVVVAVAGLLVALVVPFGDQPVANAVAGELNSAADRVGASDEPLAPGQYRYIASHSWDMVTSVLGPEESYSFLEEHLIETWVPADQRQEWLRRNTTTGDRQWVPGSEDHAEEAGVDAAPPVELRAPCGDFHAAHEGREPCTREGGWQTPNEEFMASLPRDPEELYHLLRDATEDRGQDPDLEMLVYVADLLRGGLVPADLRAALYRTLGLVPGLEVTEEVANLDGREGVAYGISAAGTRHDVIIDPATGRFIGERQIAVDGYEGIPAGTVMSRSSVTTVVVDGMGDRPAG